MKKSNFFQDIVRPFLVLVIICLAVSVLLAATHKATAPIIEENARIAAEETRRSVLPEAAGFVEIPVEEGWNVDSVYKDEGGSGYVITASQKGYGGDVVVTVGFSNEGVIEGIAVDVSTETQGVGSKAGKSGYTEQFIGLTGSTEGVDTITSATYSSRAVKSSVQAAMDAFALLSKGGSN